MSNPLAKFELSGERDMADIVEWLEEVESITGDRRAFEGVQMLASERVDTSGLTNGEILDRLAKLGYDFKTLRSAEESAIASEFERVVQRRLQSSVERGLSANGTEISAAAMRASVRLLGNTVADHIEMAIGVHGDLSPWYKRLKAKLHGFIYPIGKATGQLLENLRSGRTRLLKRGSWLDIFR